MRRFVSTVLCVLLIGLLFSGCNIGVNEAPEPVPGPPETDTVEESIQSTSEVISVPTEHVDNMNSFSERLFAYIQNSSHHNQNYMISPVSLRGALCLAIAGADDATKTELLHAAVFENEAAAANWYQRLVQLCWNNEEDGTALLLANAVWCNRDNMAGFGQDYVRKVQSSFQADVKESDSSKITNDVNNWCSEKTNGMIPVISDDLSSISVALTNALYLKAAWSNPFAESATEKRPFVNQNGKKTDVDFMHQISDMKYYSDDNKSAEAVAIPLDHDVSFVVVLGNPTEILKKVSDADLKSVELYLPKMNIESTFTGYDLITFLNEVGAYRAFSPGLAQFETMEGRETSDLYISEVMQKTRLKTDEAGLEAAAVTMMTMVRGAMPVQRERVVMDVNRPFVFYIVSGLGTESQEVLFFGQQASFDVN